MSYQNIDKPLDASAAYAGSTNQSAAPGGGGGSVSGGGIEGNPYAGAGGAGTVSASFFSASSVSESKTVIRAVQLLLELIAFSCAAAAVQFTGTPPSWHTFFIFVGVMAFIMDIAFILIYTYNDSLPASWEANLPMFELAFTGIWAIFWFCGAIAYAAKLNQLGDVAGGYLILSTGRAGAAFGFFAWMAWSASAFLAFRRYRSGSAGSSGAAPVHYNDL